ncbi:MAG: CTP synthase [Rickettsiales bacterium]|jgi:CTP synthase|nr:CTP synthase [Rickettsiales bacterium]
MTKYIFITGGVISSLGKGIAAATTGALLQARGFKVKLRKLDPYLNVDPGTMSPIEHGEVFVTDDGTEGDLDLGYYERFTAVDTTKHDTITTGKIHESLIRKERRGEFLGRNVQIVPDVTNAISNFILYSGDGDVDFVILEIGGTVGDIEGLPFFEAIGQLGFKLGHSEACFVHLTYLPFILAAEELKTKPTQHSVKVLRSLGIQPDILLCRSDVEIPERQLKKISLFCNVERENVIPAPNVDNIYKIPLVYGNNGLDRQILECLGMKDSLKVDLSIWQEIANTINHPRGSVKIALVGKYTNHKDSYKSLVEAIGHGGIANGISTEIVWVNSRITNSQDKIENSLKGVDGIIVPGGFGFDGIEGKILAIEYARKNNIPFLGICLGMQLAVMEFARNVLHIKDADSTEFSRNTNNPVVALITEMEKNGKKEIRDENSDLGGTMRLGGYNALLKEGSLIRKIYGTSVIRERHRHRYEVNVSYVRQFEENGLIFSGVSKESGLLECVEIPANKFFIATQFHPELTSRPFSVGPLFRELVRSCFSEHSR